ncbi:MAG TPA: tripartite tricarboxylate transporter TctB family protein [Stellaceae bacterium]|nr:tripartite tricarboxylate transporter TctB family protein [Stellaceae bacterium]
MPRLFGAPLTAYVPAAVLWVLALGFLSIGATFEPQSRTMPLLIGRAMLVLATLDLVSRAGTSWGRALLKWLNPAALQATESTPDKAAFRAELFYILWIAVFVATLIWLGVFVATPLFLAMSLNLVGRRSLTETVVVTLIVSAFVWTLFTLVLHLPLFPGLLFGGQW